MYMGLDMEVAKTLVEAYQAHMDSVAQDLEQYRQKETAERARCGSIRTAIDQFNAQIQSNYDLHMGLELRIINILGKYIIYSGDNGLLLGESMQRKAILTGDGIKCFDEFQVTRFDLKSGSSQSWTDRQEIALVELNDSDIGRLFHENVYKNGADLIEQVNARLLPPQVPSPAARRL